jgi:hypothetical protein
MSVDNCRSKNAEPPGFMDTKSAGETHKLLPTRLAGNREVHMLMMANLLIVVYAVAHIATQHVGIVVAQRTRS